jgi:hypothetical protein
VVEPIFVSLGWWSGKKLGAIIRIICVLPRATLSVATYGLAQLGKMCALYLRNAPRSSRGVHVIWNAPLEY